MDCWIGNRINYISIGKHRLTLAFLAKLHVITYIYTHTHRVFNCSFQSLVKTTTSKLVSWLYSSPWWRKLTDWNHSEPCCLFPLISGASQMCQVLPKHSHSLLVPRNYQDRLKPPTLLFAFYCGKICTTRKVKHLPNVLSFNPHINPFPQEILLSCMLVLPTQILLRIKSYQDQVSNKSNTDLKLTGDGNMSQSALISLQSIY